MIRYRDGVDVMAKLGEAGFTSYRLRQEHIIGERALQKIRDGKLPSWSELNKLCSLIRCHPCDLLEYIPDSPSDTKTRTDTD